MPRIKEEEVEVKVEDGESKYLCPDCHKRFLYSFNLGRHMATQECAKDVKVEDKEGREDSRGNDRQSAIAISESSDDDGMCTLFLSIYKNL